MSHPCATTDVLKASIYAIERNNMIGKFLLDLLIAMLTSKATEKLIAHGVTKLVEHKTSGIGKTLAETMINGIVKSKHNKVKGTMIGPVIKALK